ncbi:Optic atrophy 3 protein [Prunus dulcis]|uniref:Optic atrophy 3 protein n=1 Tax=Prunus dulcis TaxID=3755 RepID=A0A4Y1RBV1_PRUDU|nr:Optic atrophy 3 protein [Prunus dulcis]
MGTNLQRRLYGRATDVVIRPMDEEKAVGAAAELLGELVIFTSVALLLRKPYAIAGSAWSAEERLAIIYEVQRSARSEARKEEQRRQEIEAMKQKGTDLEKEVQCLKAKLQEMEQLVQRRSWLDLIRFWQSQALEEHKSARKLNMTEVRITE